MSQLDLTQKRPDSIISIPRGIIDFLLIDLWKPLNLLINKPLMNLISSVAKDSQMILFSLSFQANRRSVRSVYSKVGWTSCPELKKNFSQSSFLINY